MCKTDPIKSKEDIDKFKNYFLANGHIRNYAMVSVALNTSLRISDLLQLKWEDVYDIRLQRFKKYIAITEQKTGKKNCIAINKQVKYALNMLKNSLTIVDEKEYIYKSRIGQNQPITRSTAFKIIKKAVYDLNMEGVISCHSLRKTFGYQAWKLGTPPALIMSIYNHSSMEITKRYLSIDQDDKDAVFLDINL